MTDSAATESEAGAPEEMTYEQEIAQLRARQNFGLAVLAGLAAAVVGALLWAAVVYVTNMELGLVAIAVGALVGYAVRRAGNGVDPQFAVLGALCAALGWALGTVLGDIAFLATEAGRPFLDVAASLGFGGSISLASETGDAIELLFLAIAVYEGWKLSRHRIV
jgi:hypothetical protein